MTATQPRPDYFAQLMQALRKGGRFAGRLALGGLLVLAAGVMAVATAMAGLLIAVAALMVQLLGRPARRPEPAKAPVRPHDGVTLEAHRTARGWTVK